MVYIDLKGKKYISGKQPARYRNDPVIKICVDIFGDDFLEQSHTPVVTLLLPFTILFGVFPMVIFSAIYRVTSIGYFGYITTFFGFVGLVLMVLIGIHAAYQGWNL